MNILMFTDLHGDMNTLNQLKQKSSEADVVVSAGDISRMEQNLPAIMRACNAFNKPFLMIHGNHEDPDRMRKLCDAHTNLIFLHKGVHHLEDYVFMGYGGGGFTAKDPEFIRVANGFFKPESQNKRRIIMVTHGPPHGTVIDRISGEYRGNKSYREFMDEVKPHIFVAGHLHETAGKHEKIGRTFVINPGKDGVLIKM